MRLLLTTISAIFLAILTFYVASSTSINFLDILHKLKHSSQSLVVLLLILLSVVFVLVGAVLRRKYEGQEIN